MLEKCDFIGCRNQAYREVYYFKNRKFRNETAIELAHLSKAESMAYIRRFLGTRATAWSFLCRKHFTQERDACRIVGWCRVESG